MLNFNLFLASFGFCKNLSLIFLMELLLLQYDIHTQTATIIAMMIFMDEWVCRVTLNRWQF